MEKIDFRAEGKQLAWDYLLVTLGALLTAFAFAAFFLPHDIAPGGVTGIATVLSSVTGLNVGLLSFLINLPLFAIGWRRVGLRFAVRSFISMILLSLFIDVMPEFDLAGNMMLAAIFGGVTMGAGLGLVVRAGATTGGTDMAAMIVHEHWNMFTVPMVLFAIDGIVVIIAALNFGVQAGCSRWCRCIHRPKRWIRSSRASTRRCSSSSSALGRRKSSAGFTPSWIAAAPGWRRRARMKGAKTARCCVWYPAWRLPG
ncbi:MAG: YitT family protein [Christensenellales bacterium]